LQAVFARLDVRGEDAQAFAARALAVAEQMRVPAAARQLGEQIDFFAGSPRGPRR
jgi:hypothetical protein